MAQLELTYANMKSAFSAPEETWQALLWIEADFTIKVNGQVFLNETNWCIFELATQLRSWLKDGFASNCQFTYISMDEESTDLLKLTNITNESWVISSTLIENGVTPVIMSQELAFECANFIENVKMNMKNLVSNELVSYVESSCA